MCSSDLFHAIPGINVHVVSDFAEGWILDNVFSLDSDVAGRAITLDATCVGGVTVNGNRAGFGDTAMAQNPYTDSAAGGSNSWILNYRDITATLPA